MNPGLIWAGKASGKRRNLFRFCSGDDRNLGRGFFSRRAHGKRDGLNTIRECQYRRELDVETPICTRGATSSVSRRVMHTQLSVERRGDGYEEDRVNEYFTGTMHVLEKKRGPDIRHGRAGLHFTRPWSHRRGSGPAATPSGPGPPRRPLPWLCRLAPADSLRRWRSGRIAAGLRRQRSLRRSCP